MFRKMLHRDDPKMVPGNENNAAGCAAIELAQTTNTRALATGAALAVSVDTSPAVLVSIYDYAQRVRDKGRRTA